ncbi:CU044_2847 family protein [Hamadaea tsunoensis]|uniref:CU044_2847 family protein n=1 Tax=Hamadaea tsunoensis TaxID=53368 RepID=UPI001B7FC052|nr:CU044_2847 family protein [Hamadaea tsunoensis]
MKFSSADGDVVVEVDERDEGFQPVSRTKLVIEAKETFEDALTQIRSAAEKTLNVLNSGTLKPDGIEVEFGVRFNAEAGVVIARTQAEGHLVVRLTWAPRDR